MKKDQTDCVISAAKGADVRVGRRHLEHVLRVYRGYTETAPSTTFS